MLIGLTIDRFRGISPSVFLKLARKVGVNFVEVTHSVFDDLPAVLNELGPVKTGFHLPNFGDHGIDFSHRRFETEIERLIELINEHHEALRIQYCLAHPPEGHATEMESVQSVSYLFENLKRLRPPIVIENIQSLSFDAFQYLYSLAQAELGNALIGQCYDPAHYYVAGEDPLAVLDLLKAPIATIHLSDCRADRDSHLPFGMGGVLPIDDILARLRTMGYSNPINLELLPRNLNDLFPLINSYLTVVRTFQPVRYFLLKAKIAMLLPVLQRKINRAETAEQVTEPA